MTKATFPSRRMAGRVPINRRIAHRISRNLGGGGLCDAGLQSITMVIIDRTPVHPPERGIPWSGFELTPEQQRRASLAAEVAREVYAPKAAEWDRDRTPPDDEVQRLAARLPRHRAPEEYWGHGGTLLDALIVQEEFGQGVPSRGVLGVRDQRRPRAASSSSSGPSSRRRTCFPRRPAARSPWPSASPSGPLGQPRPTCALRPASRVTSTSSRQASGGLQRRSRDTMYLASPVSPARPTGAKGMGATRAKGTPGFGHSALAKSLMGFAGSRARTSIRLTSARRRTTSPPAGGFKAASHTSIRLGNADDESRDRPGVPEPVQGLRAGAPVDGRPSSRFQNARGPTPSMADPGGGG